MSTKPSPEIIVSFADDARLQLDEIRKAVKAYRQNPSKVEALDDAIRLTHSIKGSASMIGIASLGHIAYLLQEVLEAIRDKNSKLAGKVSATVTKIIDALSTYVSRLVRGKLNERELVTTAVVAYRRFAGLPKDGDQDQVKQLIDAAAPVGSSTHVETSADAATSNSDARQEDEFREEACDHVARISDAFTSFCSGDSRDEALATMQRHLHSLKGGAAVFGFQEIADLCHAGEDLLSRIAIGDAETIASGTNLMKRLIDHLADQIDESADHSEGTNLLRQIHELLDDVGRETTTAAAPDENVEEDGDADACPDNALANEIRRQIDQRDNIADDLIEVFTEEAEDHIKAIYAALGPLQGDCENKSLIQEVRRAAHTLKGAAGAVGLQIVTQLSHRMEDLLDQIYDGAVQVSNDIIALLLAATDTLHDLCSGDFDRQTAVTEIVEHHRQFALHLGEPIEVGNVIEPVGPALVIDFPDQASTDTAEAESAPVRKPTQESSQVLRVPIDRLDDLVRTASELIINRTSFEQRMAHFSQYVDELQLILERLRGISHEMDTRHSVDALRDGLAPRGLGSGNSARRNDRFDEFDSLEFDRYTDLHLISRSLAEATGDINTVGSELRTLIGDFDSLLDRQGRLARDTQDRLMRIRMVPLATLATRLHRAVRVVATKQNKRVELLIDGQDIELDKTVLEEIADPLLHLLRNAVDHGVEPAAVRTVENKPEQATIRIRAFHEGTQVVIKIADDGGGLDPQRIRDAIITGGYASVADAESFSDEELFPHIFLPGFSTASEVSEVSGRGVGMDVVREKVQKLKGSIRVDSEAGKGTTFTIRLPMTLAVTRALIVTSGNEDFAIPMQSVVQLIRLNRKEAETLGTEPMVRLGGQAYPLVHLADHLNLKHTADESRASVPVLIMRSGDRQIAVQVDRILSGRDIVVKTLGSHLRRVPGFIGATLMGDGTVVPILDPSDLVNDASGHSDSHQEIPTARVIPRKTDLNVMIVDDSVSVRRVMSNMISNAGWIPTTAKDGVDALDTLRCIEHQPDAFLVDIEMPTMDGYELLGSLRSQDMYRDTPIIMVTSRSGDKHRQKAMDLGASDYVIKPFQDEKLVALIRKLTSTRELSA